MSPIAAVLLGIGVLLSLLMYGVNRARKQPTRFEHPDEQLPTFGPRN